MDLAHIRKMKNICYTNADENWKSHTQDWCITQVKITKFFFTWTLSSFSVCAKMRECIKSSEFPTTTNFKWCLRLHFKERDKSTDIKLILVYSPVGNVRANVKLYCQNSKGEKVFIYESKSSQYYVGDEDGTTYRLTGDDIVKKNFVSDDKFTIFAEVGLIIDKTNKTSQTYMSHFREQECTLIDNFGCILENEKFCDVKLVINGVELKAHKAILSARSTVFAAMFEHEMAENDKNLVTITDINHETFKEMLNFIYTGKAPKIDSMAFELLPAADKYDLRKLKSMCEIALYRNLNVENAAEILLLADLHKAKQLKIHTIQLIKTHSSDVVKTESWRNLIKTNPKFITEEGLDI